MCCSLCGCASHSSDKPADNTEQHAALSSQTQKEGADKSSSKIDYQAVLEKAKQSLPEGYTLASGPSNYVDIVMQDGGQIIVELDPKQAPKTVENFKKLVSGHFYEGLIFHRVIPGFMIQGGDPLGTGMGGAPQNVEGEFSSNGVQNSIKHERGTISMARSQDPNSASSQFFICVADAPFLDGEYAGFGRVLSGMEIVDKIVSEPTGHNDRPLEPIAMAGILFVEK